MSSIEENEDGWFAENVRVFRERRGWSQADLARRLKGSGWKQFHPTTVSRIENGDRGVKLSEAAAIAKILQVDLKQLMVAGRGREVLKDLFDTQDSYGFALMNFVRAAVELQTANAALESALAEAESWWAIQVFTPGDLIVPEVEALFRECREEIDMSHEEILAANRDESGQVQEAGKVIV